MTENQKECLLELNELLLSMNDIVDKYGLRDAFISSVAVGFIDPDTIDMEDDEPMAKMNLLCMADVEDEEELDDLLSCVVDIYRHQVEKEKQEDPNNDPSNIDYWINLSNGDGSVN